MAMQATAVLGLGSDRFLLHFQACGNKGGGTWPCSHFSHTPSCRCSHGETTGTGTEPLEPLSVTVTVVVEDCVAWTVPVPVLPVAGGVELFVVASPTQLLRTTSLQK